jgi:hypothetical protein
MKIVALIVLSFLVGPAALASMENGSTAGTACNANHEFVKQGLELTQGIQKTPTHGSAIVVK